MDERLTRIRTLIDEIDNRERELNSLMAGGAARRPQKCSKCGQEGHSARTCPQETPTE